MKSPGSMDPVIKSFCNSFLSKWDPNVPPPPLSSIGKPCSSEQLKCLYNNATSLGVCKLYCPPTTFNDGFVYGLPVKES